MCIRDRFRHCFYATAETSAMIFLIFIGADLMNSALALTQVPGQLAGVVKAWGLSPVMVVVAIMLFYVVLGAVMDELSMIPVSYTHLRAHETPEHLVCRLLLEKKKKKNKATIA